MKNLKNKMKENKAITLIALVITIVILIILAGVAINTLVNNGIIDKAKTATEEYNKQTATETMNLKITTCQMSTYTETQKMPTLKELAVELEKDNEIQYVNGSQRVASTQDIDFTTATSIFTKLKAYPYEFEINSSLQLSSIDGIKVATVPTNDSDTIVSMTKAELKKMIQDEFAEVLILDESKTKTGEQYNINDITDCRYLKIMTYLKSNDKKTLMTTRTVLVSEIEMNNNNQFLISESDGKGTCSYNVQWGFIDKNTLEIKEKNITGWSGDIYIYISGY